MIYEIRYFASKIKTVIVSEGMVDDTIIRLETNGIRVLSVKERVYKRKVV